MNIFKKLCIFTLVVGIIYLIYSPYRITEWFTYSSDPILEELQSQLSELHPRFKNVRISEGDKSYTVNKKHVYVCVKDENGRYYNRNMLCYVILHEYAHMLCDEIGHTDKFYEIFEDLLDQAAEKGLYDPNIPPIENYCGHS